MLAFMLKYRIYKNMLVFHTFESAILDFGRHIVLYILKLPLKTQIGSLNVSTKFQACINKCRFYTNILVSFVPINPPSWILAAMLNF